MKKTLLALSLLGVASHALAIEGGTPLNWSEHDDMVKINCTGTVIGGNWVLTAAHCQSNTTGRVEFANSPVQFAEKIPHPGSSWGGGDEGIDIALWKLPLEADTTVATFLSMRNIKAGEEIKISGFGAGTGKPLKGLEYAIQTPRQQYEGLGARRIMMDDISKGLTVAGDSGAPFTDNKGLIVGILAGGSEKTTDGTRLHFARDFILEQINGWHYPTQVTTPTTGGTVTVDVQSLHKEAFIDDAFAYADATITGGSCLGATVNPFDICTYEISSNGYEGRIYLTADELITVNKGRTKPIEPIESLKPDTGSSGGSFGFLSLLGLFGLTLHRKKVPHAF